jgi:hypothetical protein
LVLRALFGASKSCALVNLFMDLPPMAGEQPADNDQILSLITAIMACLTKQNPAEPATAGSEGRPSWEPTLSTQLTRDHGSFPNARERS